MRHFSILLFLCCGLFFLIPTVYSQESSDTIQYVMADTAKARALLEEGRELRKNLYFENAKKKLDEAKTIFLNTLGEKSKEMAEVYHEMGFIAYSNGDLYQVKKFWGYVLEIRIKVLGNEHQDIADSFNNLGIINNNMGFFEKALECHQKSLKIRAKIYGEKSYEVASSYTNIGNVYSDRGKFVSAIESHQRSLEIFTEILGQNHPMVADVSENLGLAHTFNTEIDKGINFFKKALEIRIKLLGIDHPSIGSSYHNLAIAYTQKQNPLIALDYFQKAQTIKLKTYDPEHIDMATLYNDIGVALELAGNYVKSIEFKEKALEIQLLKLGLFHPNVADTYNNLGATYYSMGEHELAIEFFEKALDIRLKMLKLIDPKVASLFSNIGAAYEAQKSFEKSIAYYRKALEVISESSKIETLGKAEAYLNLGKAYLSKRELKKAKEYTEKALEIFLKILGNENFLVGLSYRNLGNNYLLQENFDLAKQYFLKAQEVYLKIFGDKHPEVAAIYLDLVEAYYDQSSFDLIENYYEKALYALDFKIPYNPNEVNSLIGLISVFRGKAAVYRERYQLQKNIRYITKSYHFYNDAFTTINYQFKTLSPASRSTLVEAAVPIYQGALQTNQLLSQETDSLHYLQESFDLAERSKALLLYQSIQESDALNFAGIPDSLLDKEYDLRVDIAYYDKKRQEKLSEGLEATDTTVLEISSELFDVQREYEALKQRFETDYPAYYQLKYDLTTASLDYVQDTLLAKDQSLLEYFVGDSSIFIFLVKQDDYQVLEIEKDFPLEDWIKQLQNGLFGYYNKAKPEQSDALYKSTLKDYIQASTQLYDKLLAPVEDNLTKDIILIPDGVLGYVPFEALLKDRPKSVSNFDAYPFLQRDHQLSYCYSATLLREMKEKQHQQEPSKSIVAFAPFYEGSYAQLDSTFNLVFDTLDNGQDTVFMVDVQTRKEFQQLPNSGEEVKVATQLWNGDYFLNSDATEDQFYQVAGDYRIVHLSTHGLADPRVGDYSYLAFAEQSDSLENEYLYVRDLYNTQLNADLVVLSACETALGELQRGEGIISLARAFAYAGAKSILTTLWVVDDAASKELTKEFYVQLKKGKSKDEALYLAKQKQLAHPENRQKHPFFWAAMIGVGDMSPID